MQVAREALALVGHGQARHLGAGLDQLAVGAHDLAHRDHRRADAQQAEGLAPGGARVAAADGRGHAGDHRGDRQHDEVPRPRQAQGAHGDDVEEEQVPIGPVGEGQRRGDGQVDDVGARDDGRRLGVHPPAHGLEEEAKKTTSAAATATSRAALGSSPSSADDGRQRDEDREDARDARRGHPEADRGGPRSARHLPAARSASPAACPTSSQIAEHEQVVARPRRAVVERVEGDVQRVGQVLDREELRQVDEPLGRAGERVPDARDEGERAGSARWRRPGRPRRWG